jgi:hypothetical protein
MNKFVNPVLATGSLLYEPYLVSQAFGANADGKGDAALWAGMQPYFDLFNIDTVNGSDLKAYLISMGAVATANKYYNPTIPEVLHDFTRYTMKSQWLDGMTYDVWYNNTCTGTSKKVTHNYTVRFKGDIFLNPAGCTSSNTGVLAFKCV